MRLGAAVSRACFKLHGREGLSEKVTLEITREGKRE